MDGFESGKGFSESGIQRQGWSRYGKGEFSEDRE